MKKIYLIIIVALLTSLLYYTNLQQDSQLLRHTYTLGQISDQTIIAPADYTIYKSAGQLEADRIKAAQTAGPVYSRSDDITYSLLKKLEYIFDIAKEKSPRNLHNGLINSGIVLDKNTEEAISKPPTAVPIYANLSEQLNYILSKGIIHNNADSLFFFDGQSTKFISPTVFFTTRSANLYILNKIADKDLLHATSQLLNVFSVPNISENLEKSYELKNKFRNKVSLVYKQVLKNEEIVRKNQKIGKLELLKINALQATIRPHQDFKPLIILRLLTTCFVLSALLFFILLEACTYLDHPRLFEQHIIILALCIFPAFALVISRFSSISYDFFLIPFSIISIANIFSRRTLAFFTLIQISLLCLFANTQYIEIIAISLASIVTWTLILRNKKRNSFLFLFFSILAGMLVMTLLFKSMNLGVPASFRHYLYSLSTASIISAALLTSMAPYLQNIMQVPSYQTLLDLSNFDNPLLKEFSAVAPGSYHHSIVVGSLAEAAAEALGGDSLLARVGSYYHDIGKMQYADAFIENGDKSQHIHAQLGPLTSAELIMKHVADGVILARQHRLPKSIIELIAQHHGTSLVSYFYHKAKEMQIPVKATDYRYQASLPTTREAAIIAIADIAESTSKSYANPSENDLKEILDKVVENLLNDKQLIACPISIRDLETVKETMRGILQGVYHRRISYPEGSDL